MEALLVKNPKNENHENNVPRVQFERLKPKKRRIKPPPEPERPKSAWRVLGKSVLAFLKIFSVRQTLVREVGPGLCAEPVERKERENIGLLIR